MDSDSNKVVEMIRPVAKRDFVPANLKRITVPQRIGIYTGTANSPRDEHSAEYQVPRAYRQLEQKSHGREWLKEGG